MLLCGVFLMVETQLNAAMAPLSQKQLDEQSELIVSGWGGAIDPEVRGSKMERLLGIHRDRVYSIKLEIVSLHKSPPLEQGKGLKELLVVEAWRPVTRIPPLPGLQGHESIPK
mgnify:CR=1 FL=1